MIIREIPFDKIPFDINEVYLGMSMGRTDYRPDRDTQACIDEVFERISKVCRPKYGYKIFSSQGVEKRSIFLGDKSLTTGGVITPYFCDAEGFAVFVASAGVEYNKLLYEIKLSGDIVSEFIADAIGSEIAEAAGRLLSRELSEEMTARGLCISNSYSPGYCGWHVSDQKSLFSLLPDAPCGITLSESCLMNPIKSISGVIAVGRNVKKMPYGCEICGKKDCYKKMAS